VAVGFIDIVVGVDGIDSKEDLIYFGDRFRGLFIYQNDFLTGIRDNVKPDKTIPKTFFLSQNYPNPFNPSTTIRYDIPVGSGTVPVKVFIYDIRGRLVRKLVDQEKESGSYQVHWAGRDDNGQQVSSGVYLYRIEAGDFLSTRKMVMSE
jgi:hypothetical protein